MKILRLDDYPRCYDFFWKKYSRANFGFIMNPKLANFGFIDGSLKGFRGYLQHHIPEITYTGGDLRRGIDLYFEDADLALVFVLKWS